MDMMDIRDNLGLRVIQNTIYHIQKPHTMHPTISKKPNTLIHYKILLCGAGLWLGLECGGMWGGEFGVGLWSVE